MLRMRWMLAPIAALLLTVLPGIARAQFGGGGGPDMGNNIFGQAMRSTQGGPKGKTPEEAFADASKKIDDVDPRVRVAALDELENANTPEANGLLMREIGRAHV